MRRRIAGALCSPRSIICLVLFASLVPVPFDLRSEPARSWEGGVHRLPTFASSGQPPMPTSNNEHCAGVPRSTKNRKDGFGQGPYVRVVYLVPSDGPDERLDQRGVLDCSVRAWNDWFDKQAGGLRWRVDTFIHRSRSRPREVVDVTFVRSNRPGNDFGNTSAIADELASNGLGDSTGKYVVYVAADQGALCGRSSYPLIGGGGGTIAAVFLLGRGCRNEMFGRPGKPSWPEGTALHELIHTESVVPVGAPHGCVGIEGAPTHVCTNGLAYTEVLGMPLDPERTDVMFPFVVLPLFEQVLDRGRDDYFGHSLPITDLEDSPFLTRRRP